LDIEIPVLTPRVRREYKNLSLLDVTKLGHTPVAYHEFTEEEQREIVFKDMVDGEPTHVTVLDAATAADYRSVIGYFARGLMRELRLVSGYDVLYGKVKRFVADALFGQTVDLESPNTIRNLSELAATKTVFDTLKRGINALTVKTSGNAKLLASIKLRQVRPFVVKNQEFLSPKKCVFNRVIGDSEFELEFAKWLEKCPDVTSFAKNYLAVNFKLDYVKPGGDISNYYPDFIVKLNDGRVVIVETKGQQDVDVEPKMRRLKQWCEDVNANAPTATHQFVYVDTESFHQHRPKNMHEVLAGFQQFQR